MLARALRFTEESVDLREIGRESPGFREIPELFSLFDGFEAESASIEISRRHVERLEEGFDALVSPVFALTGPLHDRRKPPYLVPELNEAIDERVEQFPMNLQAVAAFGVFGVDEGVKKATPRTWQGDKDCDELVLSQFGLD